MYTERSFGKKTRLWGCMASNPMSCNTLDLDTGKNRHMRIPSIYRFGWRIGPTGLTSGQVPVRWSFLKWHFDRCRRPDRLWSRWPFTDKSVRTGSEAIEDRSSLVVRHVANSGIAGYLILMMVPPIRWIAHILLVIGDHRTASYDISEMHDGVDVAFPRSTGFKLRYLGQGKFEERETVVNFDTAEAGSNLEVITRPVIVDVLASHTHTFSRSGARPRMRGSSCNDPAANCRNERAGLRASQANVARYLTIKVQRFGEDSTAVLQSRQNMSQDPRTSFKRTIPLGFFEFLYGRLGKCVRGEEGPSNAPPHFAHFVIGRGGRLSAPDGKNVDTIDGLGTYPELPSRCGKKPVHHQSRHFEAERREKIAEVNEY
ncbi:hypothetical protein B0H10DRAFT_1956817 [Mycena sp. CBHHK59/15]|nr:hypothetical protein B0H10DRAFT_1956817 [Mycena sp. CBHHK59/15]